MQKKTVKRIQRNQAKKQKALTTIKDREYARGIADGFLQGWKACGLAILKELQHE